MKTLADIMPGETAVVEEVGGDPSVVTRLTGFGLLPEEVVRVVKRAPLGDPIAIEFEGQTLSLRLREARQVRVRNSA